MEGQNTVNIPPAPKHSFKNIIILLFFAFIIVVISSITTYYYLFSKSVQQSEPLTQNQLNPTQAIVTPEVNETANWKTYANNSNEIGNIDFSIKYPDSYQIITAQQIIKRDNPQIGIPYNFLKITQEEKTNNFVLMVSVKDASDLLMPKNITYTDKIINGLTFKQYINNNKFVKIGNCNAYGYVIEKNNSIYNFFTCSTDIKTFDKMMSTFKFTK